MPDLEKVIKGLNFCTHTDGVECPNCPYWQPYWQDGDCVEALNADAITLLKEQDAAYQSVEDLLRHKMILFDGAVKRLKEHEAVEPRVSSVEQRCGNCNKVIEMDGWQFCPWCGKRIDWKGWWEKNDTRNQDTRIVR